MNEFEVLWAILQVLKDESIHFGAAFSVGLLGFWLTSTMFYALYGLALRLTRSKGSGGAGSFILFLSLSASLSVSLLSHAWLDGFVQFFTSPQARPLELIR